jgi:hypothetical protein
MVIIFSYHVDKALYFSPDTKHTIELSTTEYTYGNDMLVHLQFGKNLGIRLNNRLRYEFKKDKDFKDEQFFSKKVYNSGKAKPTTQSSFDEKLRRFVMEQTVIEQEILEEYSYTDKNGSPASVQIVIMEKASGMTATIDFKDAEQHKNFVCPVWLTPMGGE